MMCSALSTKMFAIYVIINVALLLQANSVESRRHGRIINGTNAELDQIPFQVSLQESGGHRCGATIINENIVLTAAHCVLGVSRDVLTVVAGTVNLTNLEESASTHNVSDILIHSEYEPEDFNNDIALLAVDPPFQFNEHIAPATLPVKDEVYAEDSSALVSGFGGYPINDKYGWPTFELMIAEVFTVDQVICEHSHKQHNITVRPTNICANNLSKERGFCRGDSGGPLSIGGKIIGIVSWSTTGCAPDLEPQVYTRVSSYVDWITENSWEQDDSF